MNIALLNEALAAIPTEHGKHVARLEKSDACVWIDVDNAEDVFCLWDDCHNFVADNGIYILQVGVSLPSFNRDDPPEFDYQDIGENLQSYKEVAEAITSYYAELEAQAKYESEMDEAMDRLERENPEIEKEVILDKLANEEYADLYNN